MSLLGISIMVIGFFETMILFLFEALSAWEIELKPLQESVLDSTLLALLSAPCLWFLSLQPLAMKIAAQEKYKSDFELCAAIYVHALVIITDTEGHIIYANDEFCKISGFSLDELLGGDQRIIYSNEADRDLVFNLRRTLQPGQHWKGEFCNRDKNGGLYWVDATIAPLGGQEGETKRFISIFRDISAQKENEAKLNVFKRALDASNEMIFITDAAGAIQYANPAFYWLSGWTDDEIMGRCPDMLNSPDVDRMTLADMHAQLAQGQAWSGRLLNRRKSVASPFVEQNINADALYFWVEIDISPIRNADGSLFGYVQVQRDISLQVNQEMASQIELDNNIARQAYDLVLMDCQMPTMDGYEAARILRAREQNLADKIHLPIVAVTAHATTEERNKCLSVGMDDCLSKPVTRSALMQVFARWLGGSRPDHASDQQQDSTSSGKPLTNYWNEAATLRQLEGDEDLLQEMIDLFLIEAPVLLNNLTSILASGDLSELADAAHFLKGMAGHFCAEIVKNRAAKLENNARNGIRTDYQRLTEELTEATLILVETLAHRKGMTYAR